MTRIIAAWFLIVGFCCNLACASDHTEAVPHDIKILILNTTETVNGNTKPVLGIRDLGRVERYNKAWQRAAKKAWEHQANFLFKFNLLTEPTYDWASVTARQILQGQDPAVVVAVPQVEEQTQFVAIGLFRCLVGCVKKLRLSAPNVLVPTVSADFPKYKLLIRYIAQIQTEMIAHAGNLALAFPDQPDTDTMKNVLIAAELFGDVSAIRTYLQRKEMTFISLMITNVQKGLEKKLDLLKHLSQRGSLHATEKLKNLESVIQ